MQFTGTELIRKRSFYSQNLNFGFAFDCYVDNTTGRYDFGLSGTTGLLFNFTLQSGQMLLNNTLVHSYQPYERFYIEGQISSGRYNVLKNSTPLILGGAQPSGDFSYFYIQRSLPGLYANWDLFLSGQNQPQVTVDSIGYLLTSGQTGVTGNLHNNGSYPLRVFSSTATNTQETTFNQLAGNVTGHSLSGFSFSDPARFASFDFTQPALINLATNYGNINALFSIVDARSQNVFVYLQPVSDWSFNASNQLSRSVFYTNYSGGFQSNSFNTSLSISLSYVTGSGVFSTTNVGALPFTGTGYGTFVQSGFYTGLFSGASSYNGLVGTFVTPFGGAGYATGPATAFFSGTGIGIGTGISGVSGVATGIITGLLIGYISGGQSGIFHFVGQPTGIGGAGMSLGGGSGVPTTVATGYIDVTNVQTNDNLYIGYDTTNPQIKGVFPPISVIWNTPTKLVANMSGFTDAYGINGIVAGGNVINLSALSGDVIGNTLTIRAPATNAGTITGTNYTSGIRDYYAFQSQAIFYSGAVQLTGGGVDVLATGQIDFTNSLSSNDILYVINPTGGYYVETIYQDPFTFIATLSGLSGFYGMNGVISNASDNVVNLTSSVSGSGGNASAIYMDLLNPGFTTGSNYLQQTGTLAQQGYVYAYTYNEAIQLFGGSGGAPTGVVVPTIGVGIWTGAFLNHFYTGSGTFALAIGGSNTGTFLYTRSFTGSWDVLTGLNVASLVSLEGQGFYTATGITGSGSNLPPNSSLSIQINHVQNPLFTDQALLIISGNNVLNPITQLLLN